MKIGIGIDTGGTYTDAACYDFENKKILGAVKALTTKNDLTVGITAAIDKLPADLIARAEFISLSTTLATNACVEDRGGRAKLIFFGGDAKIIDENGGKYGLPRVSEIYMQDCDTNFSGEIISEPDWALFTGSAGEFLNLDGVGIIEMNAMKNGGAIERKAKEILGGLCDIPVICGNELFSELNCLRRGSSTLLNARLFPVVKEFLISVKKALKARGITAPVVIVRSDGSMMSEEFSALRPVETLLCGPAASAIGGALLAGAPDGIVVDMGGTTTDIAIVKNGAPVMAGGGVSIGGWRTFVNGLYIRTAGLGGDSAVHYKDGKLILEEYRVAPVCAVAGEYPAVVYNLEVLSASQRMHTKFLHEHFMLIRKTELGGGYSDEEKAFCAALKNGPLNLEDAARAIGRDVYTLNVKRLVRDGIVQTIGLTPTDVMCVRGDFTEYGADASLFALKFTARNLGVTVDELCERVYREVKRKLYHIIVKAVLENKYENYARNGVNTDVENFIDDCFSEASVELLSDRGAKSGPAAIRPRFKTDYPIIGIGAPVDIFIKDVAALLGTTAIIPEHYEAANALGAVIGSVCAVSSVEIRPNESAAGITGYTAYGRDGARVFRNMRDAVGFAVLEAEAKAKTEAADRGAKGNINVTNSVNDHEAAIKNGAVYLGTTVTARAVGAAV